MTKNWQERISIVFLIILGLVLFGAMVHRASVLDNMALEQNYQDTLNNKR